MSKQGNLKNDQNTTEEKELNNEINYQELNIMNENYCSVEDILFEQQHNLHDFSFEAVDFDTKFRSMNTLENNYSMNSVGIAEPMYTKYQTSIASNKPIVAVTPSVQTNSYESLNVPNKPSYLGVSQFLCTLTLMDLINKLQKKLDSIMEVSYGFHQDACRVSLITLDISTIYLCSL